MFIAILQLFNIYAFIRYLFIMLRGGTTSTPELRITSHKITPHASLQSIAYTFVPQPTK